jgi:ankyrin repeat protein
MSIRPDHRTLTANANLESLRKEAKRWLKALRTGDAAARERLERVSPEATAEPTLRDVQHAIALEHGARGWTALKERLADLALARRSAAQRADDFLRYAVDRQSVALAAHILRRHPDVALASLHTAVVAGDIAEVERRLGVDPSSAAVAGGPKDWQPLQYLCYARLPMPGAQTSAVAIARALLDAGADPKATWKDGWGNAFTLLTGVIGEGEGREPRHARGAELAALLVERGADPFDTQALYNTSLHADDTFWLEFLYARSAAADAVERWRNGEAWAPTGALDYLLGNAVSRNHLRRSRWLLERGARAKAPHAYSKRNLHTEALLGGFTELARLLEDHGAQAESLDDVQAFHVACLSGDGAAARRLLAAHPEFLCYPGPLYRATEQNRVDVVRFLVELGVSPDVSHGSWTALHTAAHNNCVAAARLLIERGATVDIRETKYRATPLGHALWAGQTEMVAVLAEVSRDVFSLARSGNVTRLRRVLDEDPQLAHATHDGRTLLFFSPTTEERAIEIAELLLERGVDASFADADGLTAADAAEKSGLEELADTLRVAQP